MFESIKEGLLNIFQFVYRLSILHADAAGAITKGFEQAFYYKDDSEYIR